MNKNILIVAVMFVILLSGCGSSEADIQAAIAQTEAARPTNTATPKPTNTPTHTPQPTATLTPTATKTPRPTLTPSPTIQLPDVVKDTLDNPEVIYWQDFNREVIGSPPHGWAGNPNMPKVSYDLSHELSLGLHGQTVGFYYGETINPNQAVLTRFIFGANPSFTIGFYVAKGRELIPARQPGSRVITLASRFTPMVTNFVDGESTIYYFDRQVELEIDHWYTIMIGFTEDQTYFIKVWDPENSELVLSFEERLANMPSSYTFVYWAGEGSEISIDDFAILKFSSLRAADMQTAIAQTEAAKPIYTSTPEPTNTPTPLSTADACLNDLASYTGMDGNALKEAVIQDILQTFPELSLYDLPEEFFSEVFAISSPAWSPDKSQIAFSAGVGAGEMFINFGIFLLEEGGSQITRLVPDQAAVEVLLRTLAEKYGYTEDTINEILDVMGLYPWAINPVWSPDGQKIMFLFGFGDNRGEIWVINRDGSGLVSLGSGEVLYNGVWSPDSQQIIFTTPGYDKKNQIIRVNADGSGLTLLNSLDAYYESPSWSPDGQKIVAVASPEKTLGIREDADIYLMNADGSDLINLTANLEIGAINPMWAPDGQQILFNSVEYDDYVVNIDGTGLEATTHDLPVFSSDWPQCPTSP